MPASTYNFLCEQGATLQFTLQYLNELEAPIDITDATARMQVRPEINSATVILELTTENNRLTINGALGEIEILVDAEDTEDLPIGNYYYDLELVQGSFVTRFIEGRFFVKAEVTR
jgi:hypothetical protein